MFDYSGPLRFGTIKALATSVAFCLAACMTDDDPAVFEVPEPIPSALYGVVRIECVNQQYVWTMRFDGDSTAAVDSVKYVVNSPLDLNLPWRYYHKGTLLSSGTTRVLLDTVVGDTVRAYVELSANSGDSSHNIPARLVRNQSLPSCPYPPVVLDRDWTKQAPAAVRDFMDLIWTGVRLVAIGDRGSIQTSPDGVTWTSQITGTNRDLNSLAWAGDVDAGATGPMVTVGANGTILRSLNGLAWSAELSGTDQHLNKVIWTGFGTGTVSRRFVAVGNGGAILISTDGQTWSKPVTGTTQSFADVTASDSLIVAVGGGTILTSSDGVTWTRRGQDSIGNTPLSYVRALGNRYEAYFLGFHPGTGGHVYRSADGITWSRTWGEYGGPSYRMGPQVVGIYQPASDVIEPPQITVSPAQPGTPLMRGVGHTESVWWLMALAWTGQRVVAVGDNGTILTLP